jgi:hypothetical protein
MSTWDGMTTPLGTIGLSFVICLFIAKQYFSYCFLYCHYVVFIKFYFYFFIFFALFNVLACIVIHVYLAYILDLDLGLHASLISFLNYMGINFKISGGVTAPQ